MKKTRHFQDGFSLVEALVALGIGGVFLTSVFSMWTASTQMWRQQSIETKLHYALETSIERIKSDIRLADGNGILFYPQSMSEYTAISMPSPVLDTNGFQTFYSSGGIQWSRTVVYHVNTTTAGKKELRMTVIPAYLTNSVSRQTELNNIAESGAGPNGSTTRTLFSADSVELTFTPESPYFDGYGSPTDRSENITFGSVRLGPGNHTIRFEVTGKNGASTNYKMGFDQITLAPSGAPHEAEGMTVSTSSGKPQIIEDMSFLGTNVWGGNNQLEYGSTVIGDYLTFTLPYDEWLESNFSDMTFTDTGVVHTNPAVSVLSRENQALAPAWQGAAQAQGSAEADQNGFSDRTIRTVVQGGYVTKSTAMIRFKFTASVTNAFDITSAYFGRRMGAGPNFSNAMVPAQLYFDNPTVQEGTPDGAGAVGASINTGKVIPAGHHIWSNWMIYSINTANPVPDFLVSAHIRNASNSGLASWSDNPNIHSYEVVGNFSASTADLTDPLINPSGVQSHVFVAGVSEMSGWTNVGVVTSQVYDTKLTGPTYNTVAWSSVLPNASSILMKVRTSANTDMSGATAWNLIAGSTSSPMPIASLPSQRYVQFQATLTTGAPYTAYPELDNVSIQWPGQNSLVEVSGYITRRPHYGRFKVLVDGKAPVNTLQLQIQAHDTFRGKNYDYSLKTQVKAKNTGK